jgi:hypothetical protein
MNTTSRTRAWPAVGGVVATLPIALALSACSAGSPVPASTVSSAPASADQAVATAAGTHDQRPPTSASVKVPRYIAADNARKNVVAVGCAQDGQRGWRMSGTATNTSSSTLTYSIVVDFVTARGDTVVDTKVLRVGPVLPRETTRWSTTGAAGRSQVVCVIRQALARS